MRTAAGSLRTVVPPVRVGVVGVGAITLRRHLPELVALDGARVVALASRRQEPAVEAARRYGVPHVFTGSDGWRALVARDDLDAILICTPNSLHFEIAVAAVRSGKHILVEKPIATTAAEARSIVSDARASRVRVMVAHPRRTDPTYLTAVRLLRESAIGRIYRYELCCATPGPDAWAPEARWFFDPAMAFGGVILDLGIHMIDLLLWLAPSPPVDVTGAMSTVEKPTSLEDQAGAVVRFEDGCLATLAVSWATRPRVRRVTVTGRSGRIVVDEDSEERPVLDLADPTTSPQRWRPPCTPLNLAGYPTSGNAEAFIASLSGRASTLTTGDEALMAMRVVDAWYRSAHTGSRCAIPRLPAA